MKKTIFIITVFFLFMASSCKGFYHESLNTSDEECITIQLPSWPPSQEHQHDYPPLSRWILKVESEKYSSTISCPVDENFKVSPTSENGIECCQQKITIPVKKNAPLAMTMLPITIADTVSKKESSFFKPAGFIYPYNCTLTENKSLKNELTWEHGFLATIMQNIFKNQAYSKEELNYFISHFNWNKASEIIDTKLCDNSEPYNPWLLNQNRLMEKIYSKKVSSIYFNMSSTDEVPLSYLHKKEDNSSPQTASSEPIILSSFIPENTNILETKKVLLKKQQPTLLYTSKNTGIICTYYSINKISLEYILLPIYIEGI